MWDSGAVVSEQSILEGVRVMVHEIAPMWEHAVADSVGARQEAARMFFLVSTVAMVANYGGSSKQAATMVHEWVKAYWGPNASNFIETFYRVLIYCCFRP